MNLELFDPELFSPGEVLREKLKEKGWTQHELAVITGRSVKAINDVICGRSGITPDMAVSLAAAFGNLASDWMRVEAAYRISRVRVDQSGVVKRARLFDLAPIRDMQRRGWIEETKTTEALERELESFFETQKLDRKPEFQTVFRRSSALGTLSGAERAWCFRARKLARALQVGVFMEDHLDQVTVRLRELAAYPKESRHLPKVLGGAGIRFVVLEPLPGMKVDGAAFWLDETSPVIAISTRIDRLDNLWFTVMHEFSHIKSGDALSFDSEIMGEEGEAPLIGDEAERRANTSAAESLIPASEIDSFIRRVGPQYSKQRIIQFAHRIKIHPGIIVGQLQNKKEVGWNAHREMLPKVRNIVIETALTDGWGRTITPGLL